MTANIPGIVAVAVFYIVILVIGIIAGKKTSQSESSEAVMVADRSLGTFVSVFTITATMVGGGYINGSAESAAWNGVIWTQAPVGYCLALVIAAVSYAPKMRREGYITMFDPFQYKYGKKVGALMFIPQLMGDLFWSAAVLAALGVTISIVLDMDSTLAIIISSSVAVVYTFFGGLYSVAYTDVIQLFFIAIGLVIAFPFTLIHPAVDLSTVSDTWIGHIPTNKISSYIDVLLLCIFGGIPWQTLFQRVLACKSIGVAQASTAIASVFSISLAIPPMIMGIAGSAADWNATGYDGPIPIPDDMRSFILPLTLNYLTPLPVSIIGIGVVAAAVMSSADSCILSPSSVFTRNIYHLILRPKASDRELRWVLRISILVVGALGTLIAIFATTIYGLYILCSDFIYVVLFPQLTFVLYMEKSNAYGALVGFFVTFFLRLLAGEPVVHLPPALKFPYYDEVEQVQLFPFRTFIVALGSLLIVVVSLVADAIFTKEILPRKYDILRCYRHRSIKIRLSERDGVPPRETEEQVALTGFHTDGNTAPAVGTSI